MTTKFPHLAGGPPPLPQYQFAYLLRLPGDPITQQIVEFEGLTLKIREFLSLQVSAMTRDQAPRTLVLSGPPGEGKSDGALVAALNANFVATVVSAGMFASEVEGGATATLENLLDELSRWSKEHGRRVVVIINDIDLSIMAKDDKTGVSSNTNLLLEKFHFLADNRHLYRNGDGSNMAFIVTVNDATNLRASLYREGRATWHDHVPSPEDKANIAWAVLAPRTSEERDLVAKLVRRFRRQPVAFWKALVQQMQASRARSMLARGMPDAAAIDRAFGRRVPLEPDLAWACAKNMRSVRVRNWLAKRTLFGRS